MPDAHDKSRLDFPELLRRFLTKLILAPLLSKSFSFTAQDEADCERGASVVLVGDVPPPRVGLRGDPWILLTHRLLCPAL